MTTQNQPAETGLGVKPIKILVAIKSCRAFGDRMEAIRETWLKVMPAGLDYKFFVGSGVGDYPDDVVQLEVNDGYNGLCEKVRGISRWARERDYTHIFLCDDDVYVHPERLLHCDAPLLGDYVGRKRGPSGLYPAPYASGFSYWLKRRAFEVMADAPLTEDKAEDRWTGNTLLKAGILCAPDYRYVVVSSKSCAVSGSEGPRLRNHVISACEFSPAMMRNVHALAMTASSVVPRPPVVGPLSSVAVLIKTFLRDGYLKATVKTLEKHLPEAKIIIVDDGFEDREKITWYSELRSRGHECLWMPYDSGFGAKANEGVHACDREFLLIASDDFEFTAETRIHVEKMVRLLRGKPELGVVSGRVNGKAYEATLEIDGHRCIERRGYHGEGSYDGIEFKLCDLTVNFSLVRRSLLERIRWDEDVKIGGGEHGAFFIDVKRLGAGVAYLVGADIKEIPNTHFQWMHKDYGPMRARAHKPGRRCLVNRGIAEWVLQDGTIERTGLNVHLQTVNG